MNRINSDEYYNFSNNPTITDHAAENDRSQIPASITNTSDDRKLEIHQIDLQDTDFQRPLAHKTSINKVDEHKGTICSLIPVTDLDDPIKRTSISKSPESNREQNRMTNRSTKLNKLETNDSFIVSVGGSRTDQGNVKETSHHSVFFPDFRFYLPFSVMVSVSLLAAIFLIMSGIFYSQNFPNRSAHVSLIVGMAICGCVCGIGIILIVFAVYFHATKCKLQSRPVQTSKAHNQRQMTAKTTVVPTQLSVNGLMEANNHRIRSKETSLSPPDNSNLLESTTGIHMEQTTKKQFSDKFSPKKRTQATTNGLEDRSIVSNPEGSDKSQGRHHRHHRHHHRHHHHHHSHHRHHHRHHGHHHRHRSQTPVSDSSSHSDDYDNHHHHHHHHHHHASRVPVLPRIVTPRPPKIITPTPRRPMNTTMYRETAVNTGIETKIMRDSSVTANFEDEPDPSQKRIDQIPVVRRTIIVEPYPGQPTSQIVVKNKGDMLGKIRLGENGASRLFNGETIVFPSTNYRTKKLRPKKNSTDVNGNIIENLKLDHLSIDNGKRQKSKSRSTFRNIHIKNAFYN